MNVGVYIDSSNISMNGGYRLLYDQLRHWACRDGGVAMRLNVYMALDVARCEVDKAYDERMRGHMSAVRQFGYKVVVKPVKRYRGEDGVEVVKSNADLDMAAKNVTVKYAPNGLNIQPLTAPVVAPSFQ